MFGTHQPSFRNILLMDGFAIRIFHIKVGWPPAFTKCEANMRSLKMVNLLREVKIRLGQIAILFWQRHYTSTLCYYFLLPYCFANTFFVSFAIFTNNNEISLDTFPHTIFLIYEITEGGISIISHHFRWIPSRYYKLYFKATSFYPLHFPSQIWTINITSKQ